MGSDCQKDYGIVESFRKFIFKSFKMVCIFDKILHEQILNKLSKVIRNMCSMSNEMVINQKAVSNKSIKSVTNEEVSKFISLNKNSSYGIIV